METETAYRARQLSGLSRNGPQEGCFVFDVFAFKINKFENNTTKLSADEAKLTGL